MASKTNSVDLDTLAEALAARLGIALPDTGVKVEADAPKPKRNKGTKRTSTNGAKPKRNTKPKAGILTCGEAWVLLGADDEYEPRDPNRPATGPQLWALNSAGRLAEALEAIA